MTDMQERKKKEKKKKKISISFRVTRHQKSIKKPYFIYKLGRMDLVAMKEALHLVKDNNMIFNLIQGVEKT